jgi:drug/metabolite transporter (DMT)-like permease
MMFKHALAAAALLLNALIFGCSWWFFRTLQAHGLHPVWATALSYGFGLLCLQLLWPNAWRGLLQQPQLWWLVLSSGLTNLGFNWAVAVGDVMRVVLLFYLMPVWAVLLAWLLLGEKLSLAALLRLSLALTGVIIVLKTPQSPWPLPQSLPDWLALMGGVSFALTNILLLKYNHTPANTRMLAMFVGGAAITGLLAWFGVQWDIQRPPLPSVVWVGLVIVLGTAFLMANLALQYGAARLRANTTALIMLSEIVFASVSSVLLGASELSLRTLLGGALILLASLLSVLT